MRGVISLWGSQEGKTENIQKKTRFYNSSSLASPTPTTNQLHCNGNPIYVFPEKELRGLSPIFHIHVSVSDLYIPRIGPHIFLQQNRQTDRGNI
jgi:hypothetical protein